MQDIKICSIVSQRQRQNQHLGFENAITKISRSPLLALKCLLIFSPAVKVSPALVLGTEKVKRDESEKQNMINDR